jgi:hypothetical protein
LVNLTEVLVRQGKYEEAEVVLAEAEAQHAVADDGIGVAWALKHRGQIARARGDLQLGNRLIQQGIAKLEALGNHEYRAEFQAALDAQFQLPLNLT